MALRAVLFSSAGIAGAALGSSLAKAVDGGRLLALFGGLMLAVGAVTLLRKGGEGDPVRPAHLAEFTALAPPLVVAGPASARCPASSGSAAAS